MKRIYLLTLFIVLYSAVTYAQQFDISAEIRPRFESKHGYQTLSTEDTNAANFISQRTRLNFNYQQDKIKLGVSLQNVRIWGEQKTLASNDINGTALHEAWAEAIISNTFSMKLGRQEIVYDDHRIFGSVGWAQQARSHDAFIFKIKPSDKHKVDIGFAYNALNGNGADELYQVQHKNFQYAWYHGNFNDLGVSLLVLNTGYEYLNTDAKQKVGYKQTLGSRITYKMGDLKANTAAYLQMGEINSNKTNALYYTLNLSYKIMDGLSLGLGYESLSGNTQDPTDTSTENNAFAPLFGTNHKFNGWMDYFYVGNHGNSVGLNDMNATLAYKNGNFSAKVIPHMFSAAADVYNADGKMDAKLGTEIDLVLGYKISKGVKINAGYSQMLATDTMVELKGGDKDATNNWSWVMFTFKPKLFSNTKK